MKRVVVLWRAQHDNGWSTYATERPLEGTFGVGIAPEGASQVFLQHSEDDAERAKIAADFLLKQKTGHDRCSAGCSGWQVQTRIADVRDERSTANRK